MRMLMKITCPHGPFNELVKDGTVGAKIQSILESVKPEAVYFTNMDGHRGVIMIVNVPGPSSVPALAEPWFLTFDADVQFHIVMSPEELGRSGLEAIAKKWS